ncbi:hypothetical protein ACXIT0_08980 [Methylorubrum extorquens]
MRDKLACVSLAEGNGGAATRITECPATRKALTMDLHWLAIFSALPVSFMLWRASSGSYRPPGFEHKKATRRRLGR